MSEMSAKPWIPPIPEPPGETEFCDVCGGDAEESERPDFKISRCSGCKARFFCSARCQKSDWKQRHKFECGPLNPKPVPVEYTPEELEAEVLKTSEILKGFVDGVERLKKSDDPLLDKKATPPEANAIANYQAPPFLKYDRETQFSETSPFRQPLNVISRLNLIYTVGKMTEAQKHWFVKCIAESSEPSSMCHLYGPKVLAYPSQLGPAEYSQIAQVMVAYLQICSDASGDTTDKNTMDRWLALRKARNTLFSVRV